MKIVSIWNPKGGVGKTTLTLNLAAAIQAKGRSVIVADLDPQQSALMLSRDGHFPFRVVDEIPRRNGADVLVMDHPPGFSESPQGGIVIFPMRPARLDMEAGIEALKALRESVAMVIPVFNDLDQRRATDISMFNAARKMDLFASLKKVKSRAVYRVALERGRTIFDHALNGHHAAQDARQEIMQLLKK